jgi:hypothetical protein
MEGVHESELDQVRAHCERRLHDEVEQAKHDITKSLEEQIQVLPLASPSLFWCWLLCDHIVHYRYGQRLTIPVPDFRELIGAKNKCFEFF